MVVLDKARSMMCNSNCSRPRSDSVLCKLTALVTQPPTVDRSSPSSTSLKKSQNTLTQCKQMHHYRLTNTQIMDCFNIMGQQLNTNSLSIRSLRSSNFLNPFFYLINNIMQIKIRHRLRSQQVQIQVHKMVSHRLKRSII